MTDQPPPPPPGGYPPPPPPPAQPGGYYAPPPPPPGSVYLPPATPPENNTTRNVVIGVILALLLVLILAAVYVFANRAPAPSFPVIIPTATPAQTSTPRPTATQEPAQTEEAPTEQPTEATPTEAAPTEEVPTAEPSDVASGPTAEPATEPPATEPAGPSAEPTTIPGTEDQGVVIGDPVVIGDAAFPQVALLVQNVDTTVKSYSLKATFKDGDTITATATGYVSDHLQGTIRTPTLFIDGTPGPNDTVTVQIDTMLDEEDSTQAGDIAKQVTFGPPTITTGDFPTVDVEVTNGSDTDVGMTIDVGVLRDGVLVGVGSGVVTDMSAGQTKTATLYITGSIEETDQLLLTVSSVIVSD